MKQITRLSTANLKKHKTEAFFLAVLVMICTLLLGSSLAAATGIKNLFPDLMKKTGCWENFILIDRNHYDSRFYDLLNENEDVTACEMIDVIYDQSTRYLNQEGKEQSLYMCFVTADNEAKIEKSDRESTLSDEEIAALAHPIYMPFGAKDSLHLNEGDTFDLICGSRRFSFTLAGFYESVFFADNSLGLKMIINDKDYHLLKSVLQNQNMLLFNCKPEADVNAVMNKFIEGCKEYAGNEITSAIVALPKQTTEMLITYNLTLLLNAMKIMAVIIIISVAFMIRFRIASDIQAQITSIGILEAMGYTSRQIALSYALEYCMIAGVGVIAGILGSIGMTPALLRFGEIMSGHHIGGNIRFPLILGAAIAVFLIVTAIAYIKARMVRKYPPIVALRKGIADIHFSRDHFPLSKTKTSVHLRLAMKHFMHNTKQNIGLILCFVFSATVITSCFILYNYLGKDTNVIMASAGLELSDIRMELIPTADADAFAEELRALPEVRKVLTNAGMTDFVTWSYKDTLLMPTVLKDYSEAETIVPSSGRYPKHDNEVMLCEVTKPFTHVKLGDTIEISKGTNAQQFVVCGFVSALTNNGQNIYLTEEGMKRLEPTYHSLSLEVFLKDDIDPNSFKATLCEKYGRSLADLQQDEVSEGTFEEQIRAEADKKIAELMSVYGVSHVEYAIQTGDQMITGNSNNFRIHSFLFLTDIMKTQLASTCTGIALSTRVFMFIAAIEVMIVLLILMASTVKKQRREFGIMKGLGYTSKELMLQLALRVMPSACIGITIGTILSIALVSVYKYILGGIKVNLPAVLCIAVFLMIFCFICSFVGAKKIKEISVCELMTE